MASDRPAALGGQGAESGDSPNESGDGVQRLPNMEFEIRAESAHGEFPLALDRFVQTVIALRELKDVIGPHAKELDNSLASDPSTAAMLASVPRETIDTVVQGLHRLAEGFEGDLEDDQAESNGEKERDLTTEIFEGDRAAAWLFSGFVRRMAIRPRRHRILLQSIITSAVSSVEVLFSGLFTSYLKLYPAAGVAASEKQFSIVDLQGFTSIEEVVEEAIERQVDGLIRSGMGDWRAWFQKHPGVELRDLSMEWDRLWEVLQRRHAIVHHGGRPSRQYVRQTQTEVVPKLDDDYVSAALDEITCFGVLSLAHAWRKAVPEASEDIESRLVQLSYEALTSDRFELATSLAMKAQELSVRNRERTMLRVNSWIGQKMADSTSAIRSQVEAWDVSAMGEDFRIAKLALLDDFDGLAQSLPGAIEHETLTLRDVQEWPLFAALRADNLYEKMQKLIVGLEPSEHLDVDGTDEAVDSQD